MIRDKYERLTRELQQTLWDKSRLCGSLFANPLSLLKLTILLKTWLCDGPLVFLFSTFSRFTSSVNSWLTKSMSCTFFFSPLIMLNYVYRAATSGLAWALTADGILISCVLLRWAASPPRGQAHLFFSRLLSSRLLAQMGGGYNLRVRFCVCICIWGDDKWLAVVAPRWVEFLGEMPR